MLATPFVAAGAGYQLKDKDVSSTAVGLGAAAVTAPLLMSYETDADRRAIKILSKAKGESKLKTTLKYIPKRLPSAITYAATAVGAGVAAGVAHNNFKNKNKKTMRKVADTKINEILEKTAFFAVTPFTPGDEDYRSFKSYAKEVGNRYSGSMLGVLPGVGIAAIGAARRTPALGVVGGLGALTGAITGSVRSLRKTEREQA